MVDLTYKSAQARDILGIVYDEAENIYGDRYYIIKKNKRYGVYDALKNDIAIDPIYTEYRTQGIVTLLTKIDNKQLKDSYTIVFIPKTNSIYKSNTTIREFRQIENVIMLMSAESNKLDIINTECTLLLSMTYLIINYGLLDNTGIGKTKFEPIVSITDMKHKIIIVHPSGKIESYKQYLARHCNKLYRVNKRTFIAETKDNKTVVIENNCTTVREVSYNEFNRMKNNNWVKEVEPI